MAVTTTGAGGGASEVAAKDIYLPAAGKAWFGATDAGSDTATPIGGATPGSTNTHVLETSVLNSARTTDLVYVFRNWADVTGAFPGNTSAGVSIATHIANHKMVMIAWNPDTALHTPISGGWPAITAGTYDTDINAFADKIAAWGATAGGKKIFFSFGQESDLEIQLQSAGYGSVVPNTYANTQTVSAEYAAAYRHVRDRMVARGADPYLIWVWTLAGDIDSVHLFDAMYPGDFYVDWLAYDPYGKVEPTAGTSTSRTWRASLGKQTGADAQGQWRFYAWATGLGAVTNGTTLANGTQTLSKAGDQAKPIMAAECASAYNPTTNSANLATWRTFWDGGVSDMGASALYPLLRAWVFFGSASSGQYDPRNDVGVGSIATPDAGSILERFRAFAALARFNATRPY